MLLLYVRFVTCSCDQEHILRLRIRMCVQSPSRVQLFCNPMDCGPPGPSAHGISQARRPECCSCHFLPQGIFPTQGSDLRLLHWQADLYRCDTWEAREWGRISLIFVTVLQGLWFLSCGSSSCGVDWGNSYVIFCFVMISLYLKLKGFHNSYYKWVKWVDITIVLCFCFVKIDVLTSSIWQ